MKMLIRNIILIALLICQSGINAMQESISSMPAAAVSTGLSAEEQKAMELVEAFCAAHLKDCCSIL